MNYYYVFVVYFLDNRPIKIFHTLRSAKTYFDKHFRICFYIKRTRIYA